MSDCFLREGNSLDYGRRPGVARLLGHVREGGRFPRLLGPHHLPLVRGGGAGLVASRRVRMRRGGFLSKIVVELKDLFSKTEKKGPRLTLIA